MALSIKKTIAVCLAIVFFVGLDRFLKMLALALKNGQFNLIGEVLRFHYQANYYLAFSLPLVGRWLAALIFFIIIILIWFSLFYCQKQEYFKSVSLSLIILGASSNLLDRLRYGFVVDYLDLKYFTIFNLADAMIVAGVVLLIGAVYKKQASPVC